MIISHVAWGGNSNQNNIQATVDSIVKLTQTAISEINSKATGSVETVIPLQKTELLQPTPINMYKGISS